MKSLGTKRQPDNYTVFKEQQKLANLLNELISQKFYGTITIIMKHGKFVQLKKEESIKLD